MRLILLLLGLVAIGACDRQKPAERQGGWDGPVDGGAAAAIGRLERSHAGEPMPGARFRDPDGEEANLADFRGKPLLVNLWATWCAPCVIELPELDALAGEDDAPKVLAVSQDMIGQDQVRGFLAERGVTRLEAWHDPEMALSIALKVDTLPTTILYDARGREVWRMVGREEWNGRRAASLLAEAGPVSRATAR